MTVSALIILDGIVQGVGLRYAVQRIAKRLKVSGSVENLEDSTVKISCSATRDTIDEFINQLRELNDPINIDNVDVKYSDDVKHSNGFKIIPGDMIKEMMEGFSAGSMYLEKISEKQDTMIEKQDTMIEKQDTMIEKQDRTINEIRNLGSNISNTLNSRFEKIETEIIKIKAKLEMSSS